MPVRHLSGRPATAFNDAFSKPLDGAPVSCPVNVQFPRGDSLHLFGKLMLAAIGCIDAPGSRGSPSARAASYSISKRVTF